VSVFLASRKYPLGQRGLVRLGHRSLALAPAARWTKSDGHILWAIAFKRGIRQRGARAVTLTEGNTKCRLNLQSCLRTRGEDERCKIAFSASDEGYTILYHPRQRSACCMQARCIVGPRRVQSCKQCATAVLRREKWRGKNARSEESRQLRRTIKRNSSSTSFALFRLNRDSVTQYFVLCVTPSNCPLHR
jgi:hypothetical protein